MIRLIQKHLHGQTTPAQEQMLRNFEHSFQSDGNLSAAQLQRSVDRVHNNLLKVVNERSQKNTPIVSLFKRGWIRYAAAILILFGVCVYLFIGHEEKNSGVVQLGNSSPDIPAGRQGAILTLDDGRQVILDSVTDGVIAIQGGSNITLKNGSLFYNAEPGSNGDVVYNTMTTPKGRQFQLNLPDGSKVWLNAASSIRYPAIFNGNKREVEISGEVYMEIAKNQDVPFFVKMRDSMEVQVLGTSFNINNYSNQAAAKTTLVDGSIKLNLQGQSILMKPGQQAIVNQRSKIRVHESADIQRVLAWKNGIFNFEDATLEEVIKELERWYDIEAVYESGIPQKQFGGTINRNISLKGMLKVLEVTGVKFRLEGRKLIVMR